MKEEFTIILPDSQLLNHVNYRS